MLYEAMFELNIPTKLKRLAKATMYLVECKIKVQNETGPERVSHSHVFFSIFKDRQISQSFIFEH